MLMPKRITADQRQTVLRLLASGTDRRTIATIAGLTPGQVSANVAHVSMGNSPRVKAILMIDSHTWEFRQKSLHGSFPA